MSKDYPQYVCLLHGLLRTPLSMRFLATRLRKHGYQPILFGYPSRARAIEEHADNLHEFLDSHSFDSSHLHFVTHSLGSIVLRQLLLNHPETFPYKRAVMLGPPNKGSAYARAWSKVPGVSNILGPSFDQLCDLDLEHGVDNIELGIIAGGIDSDLGINPVISGDNDGVVKVEEAKLPGMDDFLLVKGWHSMMMYQPKVINQVVHFLQNGQFEKQR